MSLPRPASAAVAALVVALAVGCSGSSERSAPRAPDDQPAASESTGAPTTASTAPGEVRARLAAAYAGDHSSAQARSEAACFAEELLTRVDTAGLQRAGLLDGAGAVPEPLPVLDAEVAGAWVDAQAACADFVEVSTRALTAQSKGRLDGEAYAACLRAALTPQQLREAQVQALAGGMAGPEVAALTQAQGECAGSALPAD